MPQDRFLIAERDLLREKLAEIRDVVSAVNRSGFFRTDNRARQLKFAEATQRIEIGCDYIEVQIEALFAAEEPARLQGAVSALAGVQTLAEEEQSLRAAVKHVPAKSKTKGSEEADGAIAVPRGWIDKLRMLIARVSSHLWKLISGLLTPKSWTVQGGVGAGPFGFVNATISVTFGQ